MHIDFFTRNTREHACAGAPTLLHDIALVGRIARARAAAAATTPALFRSLVPPEH